MFCESSGRKPFRPSAGSAACLAATLAAGLTLAAAAPAAAADFQGKTVNVYIGYNAGGSYDFYGRLIAAHMGRHIPGGPTMVPINMPGVAGFRAAAFLYAAAPKDGTAIGVVSQQIALADKLGGAGVQYEASRFNYIGRVTPSVEIALMSRASKVQSIDDARIHAVPVAATSPGSAAYDYWKVLNNIGGTKFQIVGGYQSAAPMLLAMERGETEGAFTSWNTIKVRRNDLIRDGKAQVLMQFTTERHADLPDVPALVEAGRTEEERRILALYASGGVVGRSLLAPPDVPAETVAVLRRAFDAMVRDERFLAEIEKTRAEFGPMSGEDLQAFVATFDGLAPELLERARKARE